MHNLISQKFPQSDTERATPEKKKANVDAASLVM